MEIQIFLFTSKKYSGYKYKLWGQAAWVWRPLYHFLEVLS